MKKIILFLLVQLTAHILLAQKAYTGAEIYSKQAYKYGRMEMRMLMAKGDGILSTFFTYKDGSERSGAFWEEIDIEVFGKNNAETFQSNIITNNPKKMSEGVHSPGYSMGDAYHTYVLEWTPEYVAWYIDSVEIKKTTAEQVKELTNAQSFRFNIWAAKWENWVGKMDTSYAPAYQYVNWIKYYEYTPAKDSTLSDFTLSWSDDFTVFDETRWGKANWTFDGNLVKFDPQNVVIKQGHLILCLNKKGIFGHIGVVRKDKIKKEKKAKKTKTAKAKKVKTE